MGPHGQRGGRGAGVPVAGGPPRGDRTPGERPLPPVPARPGWESPGSGLRVLVGAAFRTLCRAGGPRSGSGARCLVAPGGAFATRGFPRRSSPAPQSQPPAKGKCAGAPAVLGAVWGAWRAPGAAIGPAGRPAGKPRDPGSDPGRQRGAGSPGPGGKVAFARRKKHRWRRRSAIPGREQAASSPVLTAVRPPPLNTRMRRPSARRGAGGKGGGGSAGRREPPSERASESEPGSRGAGPRTPGPACPLAIGAGSPGRRLRGQPGHLGAPEPLPGRALLGPWLGPALCQALPCAAEAGGRP